ncbi:hypothetical protein ME7_01060 [Bartonella birtlesii LL-WM9]|uniref:Uncharacterized protein n=1 Tax=Bartonella birtlesii LL-WM9 TaxID=1094552 RepID=J0PV92_9HYPH|nr:hypothetical protein ME7_01060 [Bartonella birtlesii LL-WM9]
MHVLLEGIGIFIIFFFVKLNKHINDAASDIFMVVPMDYVAVIK